MPPLVRIPEGPITPHGAYHVLHDRIPQMGLVSFDETVSINLLGGQAIADKFAAPGRVEIKGLKGLMAPWRPIDQKGATQDGTTFVTALYDPIDVALDCRVKGRDPADCRRISRYLLDSLDIKQTSRLWWFTHQLGYWWSDVRWQNAPLDPIGAINNKTQDWGLRLRADNGFWQSWPCVEQFLFGYAAASDAFSTVHAGDLGTGWELAYSGVGGTGGVHVNNGEVISTMSNRQVVARKVGYTSATNNQVVEIQIGTRHDWYYPTDAHDDAWARLNNSGTPGTSGIRMRIMRNKLQLAYFVGGVEKVMRERVLIIPAVPGEKFRLVAGEEGNERVFKVMRGGAILMNIKETGTASPLGASNRGAGLGMKSDNTQKSASIRNWTVGDNTKISQEGFITRVNAGDQDMWDNFTCFGPGTFKLWNGPYAGTNEYVQFGPLLPGQIMQIRTDPRKRGVVDMTAIAPTPQALSALQKALKDFLSFATGNNATPLAREIESIFGIRPPQGNPFSLMKGRFSKPIPAKSPGKPAQEYHIKVAIDNGNADSKIVAAGTPLRRMPL